MSICISSDCNNCNFNYLGGYGIGYFNVYDFNAICKSCLTHFCIYSEDLGYLEPGTPCFLHTEGLRPDAKYKPLDKLEQKLWKRRIKRAKKDDKKQVKLERARLSSTRIRHMLVNKVRTGILLEVMEQNRGWKLNLDSISCPSCNTLGKIVMGFKQNEICPKCKQGKINNT